MRLKNKRVLITGVTGFVGSNLARFLFQYDEPQVFGTIRRVAEMASPMNPLDIRVDNRVRLLEVDFRDLSSLEHILAVSKPDVVFHLAAESSVQRSFVSPIEVAETNAMGTAKLLEAIRRTCDPKIVFAGSSEEYGLVVASEKQLEDWRKHYGPISPEPRMLPELPVTEENPLRPMSPYAVSKVFGDYLMRNYYQSFGLKTVVSRCFSTEGSRRGSSYVTSAITSQVARLKLGKAKKITVGNVNAFRDWSHVDSIVAGYCLLAEKGEAGHVYNQGSQRTNSVLSYLLLALEEAGYKINKIGALNQQKTVVNPTAIDSEEMYGLRFEKTVVDRMMLENELVYAIEDGGIKIFTDQGELTVEFDRGLFRPLDSPVLLSDTSKLLLLGQLPKYSIKDIIREQLTYFLGTNK